MKDAPQDAAPYRDRHSILGAQRFGDDIPRPRQPATDSRDDETTKETDQPAEEESVRLAMDRIVTSQQVISRLDVDLYLRNRIRRDRKSVRSNSLDEQAPTEVERSCRHDAPANLP